MSKAQHNLKVKLALGWEQGDEYKATITVTTTDTCYHAGELKVGLPPHQEGTGLVEYLSFYFTHEGDKCGQIVRDVSKSIVVKIPSVKREVTAYAVVNGHVAGQAGEPVPRKKEAHHAAK
jgi:hypothetical protein